MKISAGKDNLIKSNRIPSWSTAGGSLGYLTHGISATQGKQNLCFLYDCNGKGQKEVDLDCNKRNLVVLVHIPQNYRKHHKLLQPYCCTHLHWQEVSRTVSLYVTFCKNNNYLGLQSTNSKMLKCILPLQMSGIVQDQPPRYYSQKNLVFMHFYFSKFIFDENVLIAQVCRVQWRTKAEDMQWSNPAYLYPSTFHFPTSIQKKKKKVFF